MQAKYVLKVQVIRSFRLHVEFLVMKPGGNSGVYLQNRYEIQIVDGQKTSHGMGAVINESESPYDACQGLGRLKLQAEGHDVRCRNIWIKELDRKEPNTDF